MTTSTSIKVITPANLGKGIEFNPTTNQWEAKSGFDCSSIDQLPERPWKKGTTLLAKQDGQCVRLSSFDTFFQEIGVGITASRTNGFTGEEYRVVVTVTNSGEGTNELTNLNISKPEGLGVAYDIKDLETSKVQVDEIERVDDFTYNIKNTKKGGTAIIRFTVVPKALGNYQFTAMVNPNSALDKDLGNNTSTIVLNAQTKTKAIVSAECPAIDLVDVASGTTLGQNEIYGAAAGVNAFIFFKEDIAVGSNVMKNVNTLNGVKLKFSQDVTFIISGYDKEIGNSIGVDGRMTYNTGDKVIASSYGDRRTSVMPDASYNNGSILPVTHTYEDRTLTITQDVKSVIILARPRGNNCFWQAWTVLATKEMDIRGVRVSNLVNMKQRAETTSLYTSKTYDEIANTMTIIPSKVGDTSISRDNWNGKQILTAKAGTAASANVNWGKLSPLLTSGLVTINTTGVQVSANATSADSVRSQYLDVIIED